MKAGQHMKHVDTREDNTDFVDSDSPTSCTRISIITVQGYLNHEEHDGGEFVIWPARLNLADQSNKKESECNRWDGTVEVATRPQHH